MRILRPRRAEAVKKSHLGLQLTLSQSSVNTFHTVSFFSRCIVNFYFETIVRFTCGCGKQYRDAPVSPLVTCCIIIVNVTTRAWTVIQSRPHSGVTTSDTLICKRASPCLLLCDSSHLESCDYTAKYRALSSPQDSLAVPSRTSLILTSCVYCRCEVREV